MPTKENFFPGDHSAVRDKLIQRQKIQKYYYDKGSKPLNKPKIRQTMFVNNPPGAKGPLVKTKVVEKCERPISFKLQTSSDRLIKRNQRHILKGSSNMHWELDKSPEYEFDNTKVKEPEVVIDQNSEESSQEVAQPLLNDKVNEKSIDSEQTIRSDRVMRKPKYLSDYVT